MIWSCGNPHELGKERAYGSLLGSHSEKMVRSLASSHDESSAQRMVRWPRTPAAAGHLSASRRSTVKKYVCQVCGYIYDPAKGDPDGGVAAGTAFEDLPADWVCPECGVGKDQFEPVEE